MSAIIQRDGTHTQGSRILALCQDWQERDKDWADDCAIVSEYYSGVIAESGEDQDTLGLVDHANYNIGRKGMVKAREETLSLITKPQRLAFLKLRDFDGTATEKVAQERKQTKAVDKFLRKEDRMLGSEFEKLVDRHVAHGDALMMFPPEGEGWRPFSARILTDPDAPQNPHDDNFTRWAVYSDLQLGDALSSISVGQEGWTSGAEEYLRGVWEARYDAIDKKDGPKASYVSTFDDMLTMFENVSPEEWANQGDIGLNLYEFYNSRYRCFYYYQKDFTDPERGIPVDFYIVARFQPRGRIEETTGPDGDPLLYVKKGAYSDIGRCMFDFVLDTNIGVEQPTWGTIKGLGHTNYDSDRWTNLLLSSMVNSAIDRNTPLMEVADSADVALLEKFIKEGYKANSIIPSGANFVDKSKNSMQVGEALNMIGFLQQNSNDNAVSQTGAGAGDSGDLRVQAINRQASDTRTASNRSQLFIDKLEPLLVEIVRRIVQELESPSFYGRIRKSVDGLRKNLRRVGVQMEWLYPDNVVTTYARLMGEGDPLQRQEKVNRLVDRIGLIPAEERNGVLMEWYAEATGDWERAENVFETAEIEAPSQESQALSKAADMMQILAVYPVTKDDVPERQIPKFLEVGQRIVNSAVALGQFQSEREYEGLKAIAQHTVLLIQVLEQRGQKDLAKTFSNEVQRIATEAQEPLNNMRAAQEAQQDPKLIIDQEKLALSAAKEAREERTFQHKQAKDQAQLQGKQRQQETNEVLQARRLLIEEERSNLEKLRFQQEALQEQIKALAERSQVPQTPESPNQ